MRWSDELARYWGGRMAWKENGGRILLRPSSSNKLKMAECYVML